MAAVPAVVLTGLLGTVLVAALLLNEIKIGLFRGTGVLGRTDSAVPGHR
jgi:hypothetical protein